MKATRIAISADLSGIAGAPGVGTEGQVRRINYTKGTVSVRWTRSDSSWWGLSNVVPLADVKLSGIAGCDVDVIGEA